MKKGDRFMIRNATVGGEPVAEGKATLVDSIDYRRSAAGPAERWSVRFDDEPDTVYPRFVHPDDALKKGE